MHGVRVKICGVTSVEDALAAAHLGADAVGLNFYPPSPRSVPVDTARAIVRALPPFVEPVALHVNRPLQETMQLTRELGPVRTIQWHGDEPEPCPRGVFKFIMAFQVSESMGDLAGVRSYLERCRTADQLPAAVLIDGRRAGQYGGTGETPPWHLLEGVDLGVPLILAGGLTPDNVAEAVQRVRPYAVDVAGGVEISPGRKDAEKLRRFIDAVRGAL